MSRGPQDKRLDAKAAQSPADVSRTLSRFMGETGAALRGLTFRENLQAEWVTFDVAVRGDGALQVEQNLAAHITAADAALADRYTKAQADARFAALGAAYTKSESDAKYALASEHTRIYVRAAGQSAATASPATPAWRTVSNVTAVVDTHGAWNGSRFTVPVGGAGVYQVSAAVAFSGLAAGVQMGIEIVAGAVAWGSRTFVANGAYCQAFISVPVPMGAVGDWLEYRVIQFGGALENTSTAAGDTWISIARVSA